MANKNEFLSNSPQPAGALVSALEPGVIDSGPSHRLSASGLASILSPCANPDCRSGWLHLLRRRSEAIFEGEWSCSAACTATRVEAAVRREMQGRAADPPARQHRVPLGLLMMQQGWITSEQLRQAVEGQKAAGQARIGEWLVENIGIDEQLVTRALSLQWNCPVLSPDYHDPDSMARAIPRLFVDAFGALPLRVAAGKILYLGFEQRLDPILALAIERMLRLRVETGLVRGALFQPAHRRMLEAAFPHTELIEAESESPIVRMLTKAVERAKPVQSRLVRVHDLLWMRMWLRVPTAALPASDTVEDVVCSLVPSWN